MAKSPPETESERQARIALKEGDAFTASRILEGASLHEKLQPGFPYLYAQALAQTGQSRRARVVLMDLLNRGNVTCDILSLVGRTFKETWLRTGSTEALSAARRAGVGMVCRQISAFESRFTLGQYSRCSIRLFATSPLVADI